MLFDRAEDAIKHGKYDIARLSLQTLINTYPDSEYVARAKLAIGDSWYDEGGTAAYAQAESEYKDFITFFPNMPEAAEAQMKIANIHFREMEKADRDPTHALRAEDEYRQMILQFPDSPLIPQAKQRLLEVQEVLARREYEIGHFYYMRDSYPAAIARLKSVSDTYPLYSGADDALFELGSAYEKEVDVIRHSKLPEAAKGPLIKKYTDGAVAAYESHSDAVSAGGPGPRRQEASGGNEAAGPEGDAASDCRRQSADRQPRLVGHRRQGDGKFPQRSGRFRDHQDRRADPGRSQTGQCAGDDSLGE